MSDEVEKASWTVKSMPVETRQKATDCASKRDETVAVWLTRAVEAQANLEKGENILPPANLVSKGANLPPDGGALPDYIGLVAAARNAAAVYQAAGMAAPKWLARETATMLRGAVAVARQSLPEPAPRARSSEPRVRLSGRINGAAPHGLPPDEASLP